MNSSKLFTNAMPKEDILNDKNYKVWSRKVSFLFTEREVVDVITDTVQEFDPSTMTQAQFSVAQ